MANETAGQTEAMKAHIREHYKKWRKKYRPYTEEFNFLLNPLRRDAIEIIKESSAWARFCVQYALIVNAGALAALPYLLSQGITYKIAQADVTVAAYFFAGGLLAAALCCVVAYIDFQAYAARFWADWDVELASTRHRHFEDERLRDEIPGPLARSLRFKRMMMVTGWVGVLLALASWGAFASGTFRLILFRSPYYGLWG